MWGVNLRASKDAQKQLARTSLIPDGIENPLSQCLIMKKKLFVINSLIIVFFKKRLLFCC